MNTTHAIVYALSACTAIAIFVTLIVLASKFGTGPIQRMSCIVIRFWQDFLDSLNSDGGHILLLAVMVWLGMVGAKLAFPKSEDLFVGAFTALLILLKSAGSNKSRRERPETPEDPAVDLTKEVNKEKP